MDKHCTSAQTIAEFLQHCPQVQAVHYPGLPNHPQYALAQRQMAQPGGMIAFELKGGVAAGKRFINALQLITRAVSLGDAESLAQHPASMTHSPYTPEERAAHFISDGLVRLSIGLEDVSDLIADLQQALDAFEAQYRTVKSANTNCKNQLWNRRTRLGGRFPSNTFRALQQRIMGLLMVFAQLAAIEIIHKRIKLLCPRLDG
jgi:hypothetical protein